MSKLSLGAAILLLSSAWTLALVRTPPTDQNPTSSTPTQQPEKSQTATIEGCLSGVVDAFVLTDPNGKSYDLTGDTTQLTDRVGHKVRLGGHEDSAAEAEFIAGGMPHAGLRVEKVHSLSAACK